MMRKTSDTLRRQWALLQAIPMAPRLRSTRELHQHLLDEGFENDIRSTQRDLDSLSATFPLVSSIEGRTLNWQWIAGATGLEIPSMSNSAALVLLMAQQYLCALMPANVLRLLKPYFARAQAVLSSSNLANWNDKVMHIETGPLLAPPDIDPVVRNVVYEALLQGQRFEATYLRRYETEPVGYTVNPLGIVTREGVAYLVCTLWEYTDIKQLAMHRIRAAMPLDRKARPIDDFELKAYVHEEAAFGYPQAKKRIRLKALFDEGAAFHLTERSLSSDQTLTKLPNGSSRLTATVQDTQELRWWLLGFGNGVEVLAPKALRNEFKVTAATMARIYT